jgi:hypothetical protein
MLALDDFSWGSAMLFMATFAVVWIARYRKQ